MVRYCLVFLFLLTSVAEARKPAPVRTILGRVVGVMDGDTVAVLDAEKTNHKVRLLGIDAPEKRQDFGQVSKDNLSNLVFNKQVRVEYRKKDRYGRVLGKIYADEHDANLKQIEAGLAWHYKHFMRDQTPSDQLQYRIAEESARQRKAGLWQQPNPTAPWDFRHSGRKVAGAPRKGRRLP